MNGQGTKLTPEQFSGAPIERAHLHRGFTAKKTPLKWIRFFRACVLQRQHAQKKKKKEVRTIWGVFIGVFLLLLFVNHYFYIPMFLVGLVGLVISIILTVRINKRFKKNYSDGYDFFSDYFSAFFTLIEEDLQPQSTISLVANVKSTIDKENLVKHEKYKGSTRGFISGRQYYYQKEISRGSCLFSDGAVVSFNFTERVRNRVVKKRSASGKRKTKQKYKSVYPFTLKMKLPKTKYTINPEADTSVVQLTEDSDFYTVKAIRKFDVRNEKPEEYNPYAVSSIQAFSSDYFSLEVINLINASYSCVTPRA